MTKSSLALIVDDEPDILQLLGITLSRMDIATHKAQNLTQARELLTQHKFDLCLTDMRLPDGDGIELISHIQQDYPQLPVALITAHGNMEVAIEAMKAGAFDFLSKPVDLTTLRNLINSALKLNKPRKVSFKATTKSKKQLIGDTPIMQQLKQTIMKLARSQAPVFINGESGTGKELVAKLIHRNGARGDQAFVPVNCGAIPSELMESEFFGHVKGSFTGAIGDKKGLFQSADGGTLFLDEIAELPINMQVKLLRAIQEKCVRPVGSEVEVPIDVRILSASHKNLLTLVEQERFRQDLFYRINVIEITVPPLRERAGDIPKLANYLLTLLAENHNADFIGLTESALQKLLSYHFPGNIRELENILERAVTLSSGDEIKAEELNIQSGGADLAQSTNNSSELNSTELIRSALNSTALANSVHQDGRGDKSLDEYLEGIETNEIIKALEQANGNRTKAAKLLGISFRAMRYKLKKLNVE